MPKVTVFRLRKLAGVTLLALPAWFGCSGEKEDVPPEGTPPLANAWASCGCTNCNGTVGTVSISGCFPGDCANVTADFCASICSKNQHTSCASTPPDGACIDHGCQSCSGTGQCPSTDFACYRPQDVCGRSCNQGTGQNCSVCQECKVQIAGDQPVCVDPNGSVCASGQPMPIAFALDEPTLPSFLDRSLGRTTVSLDGTSRVDFNSSDGVGGTTVAAGSMHLAINNCPGLECAIGILDLFAVGNEFDIEVDGPNPTVDSMALALVRSITLNARPDMTAIIPAEGGEFISRLHIDLPDPAGTATTSVRLINGLDIPGFVDLSTRKVHFSGNVQQGSTTIGLNLDGTITNLAPTANAGADRVISCTPRAGIQVQLDGTSSTDTLGPGIDVYQWFENFDRTTGTGQLIGTGVAPTVFLSPGVHAITLMASDSEGAVGIDDVTMTVLADVTPPVLSIGINDDCLWPPNKKLIRFDLGSDVDVKAVDDCAGDLSADVNVLAITSNQDDEGCEQSGSDPDPDFFRGDRAFCLRSEVCHEHASDRVYTIQVGVADAFGNASTATYPVVVPDNESFFPTTPSMEHPVIPRDLVRRGNHEFCNPERPHDFIPEGDPRCEFTQATLQSTAHLAEVDSLETTTDSEVGIGCSIVAGWRRGPGWACMLTGLLIAGALRRRRSSAQKHRPNRCGQ